MSGRMMLAAVFGVLVVVGAAGADSDQPPTLDAVGESTSVWAAFVVAGVVAGVVFSFVAGALAAAHPRLRWAIWAALAFWVTVVWLVVAEFAAWFNVLSGWCVMITTVVMMDLAFGGRQVPAAPPDLPDSTQTRRQGPGPPTTWRDWDRIDRDAQAGASIGAMADRRGMDPDELAAGLRDFRLAEDRREDILNGTAAATGAAGRDLSDEIRAQGWDAFLAETPMRLLDQAPDPGNPGADAALFEITTGPWAGERVLQVIDASPEEGVNRRVGIPVGREHTNAGTALADTWGLAPGDYRPVRHT